MPQKVYLDDNGEPVQSSAKVYLDDNGEPVGQASQAEPQGSAVGRFASNAGAMLNPVAMAKGAYDMVRHPVDTYHGMVDASAQQFGKAADDYQQGHYSEMLGHGAAGALPIIGPAAAGAGEQIASGDVAGGLGAGLAMAAAPAVMRGSLRLAKAARNVPLAPAAKLGGAVLRNVGEFDMTRPLQSTVGKIGGHIERAAERRIDATGSPNARGTVRWDPERPMPVEPAAAPMDLSTPVKAGDLSQADIRARIDAVRAQGGLPPPGLAPLSTQPTVGQLRLATGQGGPSGPGAIPPPSTPPPAAVLPESWQALAEPQAGPIAAPLGEPSPMQQPRVQVGAQKVGRTEGLTKEQVRMQTDPILNEAKGEASPILPQGALTRIIDTIKALPKGGPEREAYVQKATSGKTQWQVENIRRTLEHLGLIVPVATGAGLGLREVVRGRLARRPDEL